jgi:hypothetical protein
VLENNQDSGSRIILEAGIADHVAETLEGGMNNRLQRVKIWYMIRRDPLQRAGIWLIVLVVTVLLWRIFLMFPK